MRADFGEDGEGVGFLGFGEVGQLDLDGFIIANLGVVGDGAVDEGDDRGVGTREPRGADA